MNNEKVIKEMVHERMSFANEIVDEWYSEYMEDGYKKEKSAIFGVVLQYLLESTRI